MSGGQQHTHNHISLCLFGAKKNVSVYAPIIEVPDQKRHVKGNTSRVKRFYKSCQDIVYTDKMTTVYELIDVELLVVHTKEEKRELVTMPAITDDKELDLRSLEVVAQHYGEVSMSPNTFVEAAVTMLLHIHEDIFIAHQRFREQFAFLESRKRGRGDKRLKGLVERIDTELSRFMQKGATGVSSSQSSRAPKAVPPPRPPRLVVIVRDMFSLRE